MDRFDRIYRLHNLLSNRRYPISIKDIMEQLECSNSTATRSIENLRDNLNAPLEYSREANGYYYNQQSAQKPYQLPGLWFSAEELHGLLICRQILQNISPGILSKQIDALQQRINTMLSKEHSPQPVIADKVFFASVGRRLKDDSQFKRIATALFGNKQIYIQYSARGESGKNTERILSPQKLIYYRDNWYLAAHCHQRNDLRIFSVDKINSVQILEQDNLPVDDKKLQTFLHSSYGIFTGKAEHTAILEFNAQRAQWTADEDWHPQQQGQWLPNGSYQLSIPFNDSRELVMDILKYGADVKVVAPEFLQQQIIEKINALQAIYQKP